jgi:glycosyltransferase involved in cell wall biosynthesis
MAEDIGVSDQLTWQDASPSSAVADLMNKSKVVCIPSTWDEPFGIVALEAMACGCEVVATNAGGLPDAVGQCGLLFPKADAVKLADFLEQALSAWRPVAGLSTKIEQHLAKHTGAAIVQHYLRLLQR